MDGSDLIVFIMARGGSTRIPLKNIVLLEDRPLISYTLEDVRDFQQLFPEVQCVVMSDHPQIRYLASHDACRPSNFEVIEQSPEEASDSMEWLGIRRVLKERETSGRYYSFVMLLGADHVLRADDLLPSAYRRIQSLSDPKLMVQSAVPIPIRFHPCRAVTINPDTEESDRWPSLNTPLLSQELPKCYAITGGVFLVRRGLIDGELSQIEKHVCVLPTVSCVEIDTADDLSEARDYFAANRQEEIAL